MYLFILLSKRFRSVHNEPQILINHQLMLPQELLGVLGGGGHHEVTMCSFVIQTSQEVLLSQSTPEPVFRVRIQALDRILFVCPCYRVLPARDKLF